MREGGDVERKTMMDKIFGTIKNLVIYLKANAF